MEMWVVGIKSKRGTWEVLKLIVGMKVVGLILMAEV